MGNPERNGALAGIGHTPIVRLSALPGADDAEVWVKLEAANPTGSYKDRMALAMIEGAERSGRLQPGRPWSSTPGARPVARWRSCAR